MPKTPVTANRRKSTAQLVNSYGFSLQSIRAMQAVTPYLSLSKIVDSWAKFLLKAESREEQRWQVMGVPLIEKHYGQKVVLWKPKAVMYQLPGGRYSPDFYYILEDGLRVSVETKGSPFQHGYKDARAKIRAAATLYWFDRFMMVMWKEGAWQLEEIEPDKDFRTELQVLAADVAEMIENEGVRKIQKEQHG
jgi:hypothetical protein